MRVNPRVYDERQDMFQGIRIPNCKPDKLKVVAERLMDLATKPGFSVPDYHSMTELDKQLMLTYWAEYDGMNEAISTGSFNDWFIGKATAPEMIRRAREWLAQHNYIIIKEEVQRHALKAGENMRGAITGGKR